jgi:hypothetical protein
MQTQTEKLKKQEKERDFFCDGSPSRHAEPAELR